MKQDKAQQAARDEKLVPIVDRNSPYYNAFLTTAEVLEIYMQQFRFTITKVKKSSFYQFDLDNKKCQIDVELFQEILGICLRVLNQEFTVSLSHDSLINFLMDLGYKGQMKQISDMFIDHMYQPWRTLGTIINRCLSGKTSNNDRL
ncbi:hypothetical protein Tco_1219472 [Tanacetum coccineum]